VTQPEPPHPSQQPGDGLPPRSVPWVPAPANATVLPAQGPDGSRVFLVILDTGTARSVSYWQPAELRALAEQLFRHATGGLTVADAGDLAKLKDTSPFERP
jgi:hypothetical protein